MLRDDQSTSEMVKMARLQGNEVKGIKAFIESKIDEINVNNMTTAKMYEHLTENKPLLIRNGSSDWEATSNW